jgi:hypothetical protein
MEAVESYEAPECSDALTNDNLSTNEALFLCKIGEQKYFITFLQRLHVCSLIASILTWNGF